MKGEYIEIGYIHLAWCAGAFLLASFASLALRLSTCRTLVVAATRMTVQLFCVGWVLHWLIEGTNVVLTARLNKLTIRG